MKKRTVIFFTALIMLSFGYASAATYSLLDTNEVNATSSEGSVQGIGHSVKLLSQSVLNTEAVVSNTLYFTALSDIQWSNESMYHPENYDRIVEFNDSSVIDEADFRQKVANAGTYAIMKIVDHRSGSFYYLRTRLLPPGNTTRLGIYIADCQQGGVVVTGVMANSPGYYCQKNVSYNNNSGNTNPNHYESWSAPMYHPENGDRIIVFNNMQVLDEADFRQKVANCGPFAHLKLIDYRTGRLYELRTQLNPPGSYTRLGIYIQSSEKGGVIVTGVMENSPGRRCQLLTGRN